MKMAGLKKISSKMRHYLYKSSDLIYSFCGNTISSSKSSNHIRYSHYRFMLTLCSLSIFNSVISVRGSNPPLENLVSRRLIDSRRRFFSFFDQFHGNLILPCT